MIYLDHSATTPMHPEVIDVMADVMRNVYGNPSSLHGLGAKAERLVDQARQVVARTLGCTTQEIFFTSGGTEANNLAIQGVAEQYQGRGKHLITTQIEHPAVLEVVEYLEKKGWRATYLPVDAEGRVHPDDVEAAITEDTVLVSIMQVNNEVGTIQPIAEIGKRLQKYPKLLFHVDAVQACGKISINPVQAHVDLLSLSGHKFHGPKGVGALYIRKNLGIAPLVHGGGQERGLRSGTYNVPGIVGLAKALAMTEAKRETFLRQTQQWKEELLQRLRDSLTGMRINAEKSSAPYIISLSFAGLKSEVIVHALEEEGVYVSSKSACSSKLEAPSPILKAMGLTDEEALGSIRISMGFTTTQTDVEQCTEALLRVIPRLQKVMKVSI